MPGGADLTAVLMALGRLEAKIDLLLGQGVAPVAAPPVEDKAKGAPKVGSEAFFRQFTPRQHATLQMLLRGVENREIAERLGVSENTVKVHVRNIARRLGVNNRVQVALRSSRMFDEIDDNAYRLLSGGLPKNWDETYSEPDPFGPIYKRLDEEDLDA